MDTAKLKKLEDAVRIGGKGTARRKHKHVQRNTTVEEKRLQAALQKLTLTPMSGIQQISLIMVDGSEKKMMNGPKVQGAVASNLFVLTGEIINLPKKLPPPKEETPPELIKMKEQTVQPDVKDTANDKGKGMKTVKKQRIRVRARNKAQKAKLEQREALELELKAGGDAQPLKEEDMGEVTSNTSTDSDKTSIMSDSSDQEQTVVGDNDSSNMDDDAQDGYLTANSEEQEELEEVEEEKND